MLLVLLVLLVILVLVVLVVLVVVISLIVLIALIVLIVLIALIALIVLFVAVLDIDAPSGHQKVAQDPQFLAYLTSTCASRQNSVHFFDMDWPSNRPKVVRTCAACAFSLPSVLRATTACTFPTSQLPKVLRDRCVLTL